MRSPNAAKWRRLFGKDRRELASSWPWIVLLVVIGPLVGRAFTTASPLGGVIGPVFDAYAIAVVLLFPFVAIRLISSEKRNGALKLLLQSPVSLGTMIVAKLVLLVLAWFVAWIPGLIALALWRFHGGYLARPELLGTLLGQVLWATLICSIALAAAALTANAATAAIVTLAITLGTWAFHVVAQARGGIAQTLDAYTPESALRTFETGEIRIAIVLVTLVVSIGLLALAVVWLHPGRRPRRRIGASALVIAVMSLLVWIGAQPRSTWDVSEDRVLGTVYQAAAITPPTNHIESAYSGNPLVARPAWTPLIFYFLWPVVVLAVWLWARRAPKLPSPTKAGRK